VKWRLKGHAQKAFFEWVSSWSISARRPSDLGFSDARHILPQLIVKDHIVTNDAPLVVNGQFQMFNIVARTMPEIKAEGKATIEKRCETSAELAKAHDISVFWCNLDKEADLMEKLVSGSVQISGKMKVEKKEEILLAFSRGEIKKLITKPRITSFGLNWQHCAHAVFFPNFSYEQYYQGVRRFWRFGQKSDVKIDRVISDGQVRQIQALEAKSKKADELFTKLNASLNSNFSTEKRLFEKEISLPSFL
jgi:superfamily II DNA or RNA helicase